ncbi:hypothetical protein TeGR_g2949 [Tetraparma gracilis]|uniref:Uncharacterized protein n=1 Tax=Tetraparma gracilis TaxID=2962635 RepID=A0ABQ6MS62_9STRA|nr:hypothetical protein TeGR_g2949 [Tetraparma gracilis]
MSITTLELEPGFWRTTSTSTAVLHCPSRGACVGGSDPSGYCAEGHTGAYCGVCLDGYSEVGTSLTGMTCVECTGSNKATVALGAVVLAVLLIAPCVYFWLKRRKSEDVLEAAMGDAKAALATKKQLEKKKKAADAFLNNVQTPFKILLSYAQIVSGFSFNFGIRFPKFFSSVMTAMSFANLDFISVTPMGCLFSTSYHHQLLTYTVLPLVAFAALLGLYKMLGRRSSTTSNNELRDQVFNSFLLLTFLVLPTTSTKILNTFACYEFDDGSRQLKGDLGIDCDSATHKFFELYAKCMIVVYPVGIPAMYFVLLYKAKHLLDCGQAKLVNTKIVKLVKVIEEETGAVDKEEVGEEEKEVPLVPHVSSYITEQGKIEEAVENGDIVLEKQWVSSLKDEHKPLLEFIAKESNVGRIFWHCREDTGDVLGVEVTLSEEGAMVEALRRRAADEEAYSLLGRMKFLYAAYEPSCWWFEVFETLRRLLLTGGQVILNQGTPSQIVLNLIICIFSMKMYATYSPFVNAKADKLAEIAQYQLFFTMLAALCIKVDISKEDNYNKRMFDGALAGLQFMGPVLLVAQGFVQGGAKGAALNTEMGGAMDEVRAMTKQDDFSEF